VSSGRLTLGSLLEERARADGEDPFLAMAGGVRLTFGAFNREVNRVAHGLAAIGVGHGDPVAIMLPNSLEFLLASYALKKLGAVEVAVNRAFRGPGLVHALNQAPAELLIAAEEDEQALVPVLDRLEHLRRIVRVGDRDPAAVGPSRLETLPFTSIVSEHTEDPVCEVSDRDVGTVLFTSGTTGRSKGCMLSHRYAVRQAELIVEHLSFTHADCIYSPFPLFHFDTAFLTVGAALVAGAQAAVGARFSRSRFWQEVRELDATVFDFMGATLTMLWKEEELPDDAANPVRLAFGVPMPRFRADFERRFGLKLVHAYGLTDAGVPCYEDPAADEPVGSCGRPHHPYEVRILDDRDDALPVGAVGEIAIRPLEPDVMMQGYWGMPEATVEAFRNLWFHTGDLGRIDAEGHLFFEGRKKDAIRRRGENISAHEIEEVLLAHDHVEEVAAVGVPSELTEEDVAVFIVLTSGATVDAESVREFCRDRMARYMVPEHVVVVDELPKTETGKVEKHKLVLGGPVEGAQSASG
jgi:crotonobetaine/carnitine-CoA ligase